MTEQKQDRPATLTRRAPQPAPDENVDPVDTPAQARKPRTRKAAAPAAPPAPAPKQREAVFPLSTRVSAGVLEVLETVTRTGVTQRAAIEHAIMQTYGQASKK